MICLVLLKFSERLLSHQTTSCLTLLQGDSSSWLMMLTAAVSSADLMMWFKLYLVQQSGVIWVNNSKRALIYVLNKHYATIIMQLLLINYLIKAFI